MIWWLAFLLLVLEILGSILTPKASNFDTFSEVLHTISKKLQGLYIYIKCSEHVK